MKRQDLCIFATGVHLIPRDVSTIEGKECWIWQAVEFEDSSFLDGEYCDPNVTATYLEDMLRGDEDEV